MNVPGIEGRSLAPAKGSRSGFALDAFFVVKIDVFELIKDVVGVGVVVVGVGVGVGVVVVVVVVVAVVVVVVSVLVGLVSDILQQ